MCCCNPCVTPCNAGFFGKIENFVHDAFYGTLSTCQKNQLIANENQSLSSAVSGNQGEYGAIPSDVASTIAAQSNSDVTGTLQTDNACPSQSVPGGVVTQKAQALLSSPSTWIVLAILAFAVIFVYGFAKGR